jgi:hypothetical protein
MVVAVEPAARNRIWWWEADSDDYFRSSAIELEGEHEKRLAHCGFRSLPAGTYEIRARVMSKNEVLGTAVEGLVVTGITLSADLLVDRGRPLLYLLLRHRAARLHARIFIAPFVDVHQILRSREQRALAHLAVARRHFELGEQPLSRSFMTADGISERSPDR